MSEDVVEDMLEDMVKDVVEDVVEDVVGGCVPGTRRRTFECVSAESLPSKILFLFFTGYFSFFSAAIFRGRPASLDYYFFPYSTHSLVHSRAN